MPHKGKSARKAFITPLRKKAMTGTKLKRRQHDSQSTKQAKVSNSTIRVPSQAKSQAELAKLKFAHGQRLSCHLIDLIDFLTEAQKDWICLLHPDWEVDLRTFNLLSTGTKAVLQQRTVQRLGEIVPPIPKGQYEPRMVNRQLHWVYTCCLQIKGLGRVRIVIDFHNSRCATNPVIFATNRLDWSARKVLTQWFQRRPPLNADSEENPQALLVEAFCQREA